VTENERKPETRSAEIEDHHTGELWNVSYTPATGQYKINGVDVTRNQALENEEGVAMFQGKGIVAHIAIPDLDALR